MPAEFRHLDAEIRVSDTGLIEGDILYSLIIKDELADSLILDAPGIEIISVELQNEPVDSYINTDKLIVDLPQRFERGRNISLRIQYRSNPDFGVHQTSRGSFFTSNLPLSTSHWLPVVDHPSVEFTAEFIFIHPASKLLVMNGRRGEDSVLSVDEEVTVYSINRAVSPTGLNWVLGDLVSVSSTAGNDWLKETDPEIASGFSGRSTSRIFLYSEVNLDNGNEIITTTAELLLRMQQETGISYPFRDLQLILLQDDYWETKPYGSGIVYLFNNRGDIMEQVKEAIVSQWFGAKLRERQWTNTDAIQLLRASQLFKLDYKPVARDRTPEPYHVFDSYELMPWINFIESRKDRDAWDKKLSEVTSSLFMSGTYVMSYNDLANEIYNISGIPMFNGITPDEPEVERDSVHVYTADILWETGSETVEITFQAENTPVNELVNVTAGEITSAGVRPQQFTFTGENDTIVLSISPFTENVTLDVPDNKNVRLSVNKPFQFWVYQLQNSGDVTSRAEAAEKLAEYSDNPDLQLALTDFLRNEENATVLAQILRSVSSVTKGASGTQQLFLQYLETNHPDSVRIAATEGLTHFPGDEQIISRLRSTLVQTGSSAVRKAAARSLYDVTEPEAFRNIMERSITEDQALNDVPYMLNLLAKKGEDDSAVRFGETFLSDNFPYEIRKGVLDLIQQYDDSSEERWHSRLQRLLFDRDPRIRYYSANALKLLSAERATEILDRRLSEEYDERVRRKLQNLDLR